MGLNNFPYSIMELHSVTHHPETDNRRWAAPLNVFFYFFYYLVFPSNILCHFLATNKIIQSCNAATFFIPNLAKQTLDYWHKIWHIAYSEEKTKLAAHLNNGAAVCFANNNYKKFLGQLCVYFKH